MNNKIFYNYLVIVAIVVLPSFTSVSASDNMSFNALSSHFAQDESDKKAFKNLGIGLEFSSTGLGLELTTPLNSFFALRGGLSLLPLKFNTTMDMPMDDSILQEVQNKIDADPDVKAELAKLGITQAVQINSNADMTAALGLVNGKLLVDFYPLKRKFHLTGGFFVGKSDLVSITGKLAQAAEVFTVMENHGYDDFSDFMDEYNITFRDIKDINAALTVSSIKPYLGFGFGRAIPKRLINVKFEMGALFWGTPELTSKNKNIQELIDGELGGMNDVMKKLSVYPVISLKVNFKAF